MLVGLEMKIKLKLRKNAKTSPAAILCESVCVGKERKELYIDYVLVGTK